jgi:hypothetical protein
MQTNYTIVHTVDHHELMEIFVWCNNQFGQNNWKCGWHPTEHARTFEFLTGKDRTLFTLRWA